MKLNCDLGEKVHDNDALIMPFIDQANIACGFHASDPLTIRNTVLLAKQYNVQIGAHPSYPDRKHFGRRSMHLPDAEIIALLHYQIGALQGICHALGTKVSYVKPHGALYNDMMSNPELFNAICKAISQLNANLLLMVQALPHMQRYEDIARQHNVSLWYEAFADRAYTDQGTLVSRKKPLSVISDQQQVITRSKLLLTQQKMITENNKEISLTANTLCVHGDNHTAIALVKSLRDCLNTMSYPPSK